ncbi:MAG: hypothetical protein PHD57_11515 [Desulfobacterales bacterium]|nr:hypothetical protein [Desulfobacterales bacterium]MDD3082771.1 hypothetical protein [Desulfobacterales bacterium]MDD3951862.1 hypothetical protein [Desulfobacterales bacterium]
MIKFSGFDDWIEIFRGGEQKDSSGDVYDGDKLIDTAVATFNPAVHEPPVVIGHPETDAPAYGWVEALKKGFKDGVATLYAKFKNVCPDFAEILKKGFYKKRSAAFYSNGSLRHVGFLGAMPPAVKGLTDVEFGQNRGGNAVFEFPLEMETVFSETEFNEKLQEGIAREKNRLRAEFAEKERQARREAQKQEIAAFVGGKIKDGILPPALADAGLVGFMNSLDSDQVIQFSETGESKSQLNFMTDLINTFQRFPLFTELATKERAGDGSLLAEDKRDADLARKISDKAKTMFSEGEEKNG